MTKKLSLYPLDGVFELRTSAHLREKLRFDFEALKEHPRHAYFAWNFFVTAEHMLDWVHPGLDSTAREAERKGVWVLQACGHIANGAKHYKVEAPKNAAVSAARRDTTHFGSRYFGASHFGHQSGLVFDLVGDAQAAHGPTIGAVQLAELVMGYWDNRPL